MKRREFIAGLGSTMACLDKGGVNHTRLTARDAWLRLWTAGKAKPVSTGGRRGQRLF
jgi:hypothetical protein